MTSAAALLDALRQFRLLEPKQLEELTRSLAGQNVEPRTLAAQLIERGWLTPYQVNQLLQGKGAELLLGSYVLLERLGEGGMGAVFKARNWKLGQTVALKLIRKERVANTEAVRRFQREIRAAAHLNHPHIVRALDADEVGGTHLLVMEHVAGTDLARLVKEQGPLPVGMACDYLRQAALGLQHAFERGMVHRDIKPHNLLVSGRVVSGEWSGPAPTTHPSPLTTHQVKILDMGLARLQAPGTDGDASSTLTQEGAVMGTPDYIAPEQAMGAHDVDIRADLYSLGCTLYFLLTGRPPFPGGTLGAKLIQHKLEEPEAVEKFRPDVSPAVVAVLRRLMAKEPKDRYQTPAEAAAALAAATDGRAQAPARRPTGEFASLATSDTIADVNAPPRLARRRRWLMLNAAGGLLLLSLLGLFGFLLTRQGPQPSTGPAVVEASSTRPTVPAVSVSGGRPPLAVAPFTEKEAKALQKRWSDFLQQPVEGVVGNNLKLVLIPPGEFLMGAPDNEDRRKPTERPQNKVRITKAFYLGAYEITQAQYEKVMGKNPAQFKLSPNHPVENVSWDDAMEFCKKLSELPEERQSHRVYRLPTEAEWEYACRAGTTTPFSTGASLSGNRAKYLGAEGPSSTIKVGSFLPNAFGLYDMHGNVGEWCLDVLNYSGPVVTDDPRGPSKADKAIDRGGSWALPSAECRSASRGFNRADMHNGNVGFRVVCDIDFLVQPGVVNLLALIDPGRDQVVGAWKFNGAGELLSDNTDGARIQIPYRPPEEYDLHVAFTRNDGRDGLSQVLVGGGQQFQCTLGGYGNTLTFLELVNGQRGNTNPTTVKKDAWLQTGVRHESLVQVRKDGVKLFLDKTLATHLKTDFKLLSLAEYEALKDSTVLGLGSWRTPMTFHKVEIVEISGPGTFTRPDDKAAITALLQRTTMPAPRQVLLFRELPSPCADLAFSPDGKTLAAVSSVGQFALYDGAAAGQVGGISVTTYPTGAASVTIASDSKRAVIRHKDGKFSLWEISERKATGTMLPGIGAVKPSCTVFDGDGRELLIGGEDGGIYRWDMTVAAPKEIDRLPGRIVSLTVSADGKHWAAASDKEGTIHLDGNALKLPPGEALNPKPFVLFSPDGRFLLTAPYQLDMWFCDLDKRQFLRKVKYAHPSVGGAFSPDGRMLATVSPNRDATIVLWDTTTWAQLTRLHGYPDAAKGDFLPVVVFAPDGRTMVTAGGPVVSGSSTLRFWDVSAFSGPPKPSK